jgi:hypothetical protein
MLPRPSGNHSLERTVAFPASPPTWCSRRPRYPPYSPPTPRGPAAPGGNSHMIEGYKPALNTRHGHPRDVTYNILNTPTMSLTNPRLILDMVTLVMSFTTYLIPP